MSGTDYNFTLYNNNGTTDIDLASIFTQLSNLKGPPTGYIVNNSNYPPNSDLADIFQFSIPFTFQSGSGTNYNGGFLTSGYFYLQFKPDPNQFIFTPTRPLIIYQLFLVGAGNPGSGKNGGNGGEVSFNYNSNTTIGGNPIPVNSSNTFTFSIDASNNYSTNVSSITDFSLTASTGGGASEGMAGIQNVYTGLTYGGGGGYGGIINQNGGNGGLGGGGGGGGGGYSNADPPSSAGQLGGNGGGISSQIGGGGGGTYGQYPNGISSQYGGGGGGGQYEDGDRYNSGLGGSGGQSGGGSGGEKGNIGGGGGGGGVGGGVGGGGLGTILLIYNFQN